MASARILLVCSLIAALAACRAEVPRQQSLKDYAGPSPAAASVAAPPPAPAPVPPPVRAPAAAAVETEPPKDQQHASCWDRYRDHLAGEKPGSYEEKLSADAHCRLIVCPDCPAEVRE